ncbi:hypothetical protein HRI_002903900 [Hibiscus trionum]|uniref:BURP domain-containing protein n=1 Tax=Hibiscus trionum TaxID=183268 RepID=A0A9W7M9H0_HIBTR|nr:hypothetical protein HRI_002903900 [Hibiscus trionum]
MALHFLVGLSLLNVAFAGSHGALSSEEVHWKSVFPNTPMPKALKNLLPPPPTGTSKKSKGVNAPVNPFIIYESVGKNKKSKGVDAPVNPFIIYENAGRNKESKGVNVNPFIIYENAGRNKRFKGEDAPVVNPFIIYENGGRNKESKGDDAPVVNPFIIYENGDRNKGFKGEDAPVVNPFIIYENSGRNKGFKGEDAPVVNPFIIYENSGRNKGFKGEDAPVVNPFIIYENGGRNKGSKGEDAPVVNPFIIYENGGRNKGFKGEDAPVVNPFIVYENGGRNKESKGEDAPVNPFIIYGKHSKGKKSSVGRKHGNAAMNETIYFFQEDLRPGKMVNLPLLAKTGDFTPFLPHRLAQSIPFSSDKFPEILKHFSFGSNSMQADAMKQTIKGCERQAMRGEQMFCATSFDSFVDSSVSKLGKSIQLLANELGKETNNPMFSIGRGIQNMGEEELVCHKMRYPYAVFLCHSIEGTVVYKVPLVGIRGTKANALAVCHKDTSAWSPNHPAFLILNVKPGTVPICHFVVRDTLVWVTK